MVVKNIFRICIVGVAIFACYLGWQFIDIRKPWIGTNGFSIKTLKADIATVSIEIDSAFNYPDQLPKDIEEKSQAWLNRTTEWLVEKGIDQRDISVSYGEINQSNNQNHVSHKIKVTTTNVDLAESLKSDVRELLNEKVPLKLSVKYDYTDFEKITGQMLEEASRNAFENAKKLIYSSNAKITGIRQIRTLNQPINFESSEISKDYCVDIEVVYYVSYKK